DGIEVVYAPVNSCGRVDPQSLRSLMTEDTALVSVMLANNEVGTMQPVAEIAKIAHEFGALMHTDAVQAVGHIPVDVQELGIDLLSFSAHKFGGPKGIGVLYIKSGTRMTNLIYGGAQEKGMRAGTENLPGIVGMAKALQLALDPMANTNDYVSQLRDT
ncbi:MAG: aminotransferase class V-fold PLP-dependent enzyme, partial [Methanobrevibacter sp.]|nr:aminotransferase class V-fold PLP-dependent enzyme [Methanobrevibacter sp.]